jgi:hypothetical protein
MRAGRRRDLARLDLGAHAAAGEMRRGAARHRLGLVHGCGVDMPVAERERALDHRLGGGTGQAERAEAEPGHRDALRGDGLHNGFLSDWLGHGVLQ